MKTTFAVLLTVGWLLVPALAQQAAPVPAPADAPEVFGEIPFNDAPLLTVIKALSELSDLKLEVDPKIAAGRTQADGTVAPLPTVTVKLTNVTARQALDAILKEQKLAVIRDANNNWTVSEPNDSAPPGLPAELLQASVVAPVVKETPAAPGEAIHAILPIGEMPLQEVIQLLAEDAKIDIMFDPKLLPGHPTATNVIATNDLPAMKLYNKTSKQALEAVLANHDLIIVMDTNTQIARITRRPPPELEPLLMSVVQLRYANVTNLMTLISGTFPTGTRNKLSADGRTSQLVVVATARDLEAITNLVTQLDTPTKQVLIEARLLETSRNPRSVKGIDWAGTLEAQNFSFGNGNTIGETITKTPGDKITTTLPSGRTIETRQPISKETTLNTIVGNGGLSLDTARGFFPNTAFLNADGVRAVLSFLNTDSDTEVLATPRAVTLDNEPARLEVSRAFPIFEITPGSANSPAGATIKYTNLGTILTVTPRIAADSNIAMKIVPEVSNIDSVDRQIVNGVQNTANIYAIRKVEARVTIPSGNTLVMGGLISDSLTKGYTKVPLLGDIPGIGYAFRKESKTRSKANLLIFVTPTIVTDGDFQPTGTTFLQNKPKDKPDVEESAWDSGKPKQWRKRKE